MQLHQEQFNKAESKLEIKSNFLDMEQRLRAVLQVSKHLIKLWIMERLEIMSVSWSEA